jgi:Carboxypeptidase regulatory-like domain
MKRMYLALTGIAAFLIFLPAALGQSQFATLSGTTRDATGAVVNGANVIITNASSGEAQKIKTNQSGYFSVPNLLAGTYRVTVEMQGFQKWQASGIVLNGSDTRTVDVNLVVGASTETVEVKEAGIEIATVDSGEKSALITSEQLQDLSLVGRNATEYLKLLPGATLAGNQALNKAAFTGEVVGINFSVGGQTGGLSNVNINGQQVDITMDGQHSFDPGASGSATPINPNPNMISEVKVLSSNFSAENPKGPVVVNTVTKSGGSSFHGEAYINVRNTSLNAEEAFNKETEVNNSLAPGALKVPSSFYYPGFNIGGPVLIPGTSFNRSRKKVFFFEGYENYHQTVDGGIDRAFVPTADMLNGNFSALSDSGSLTTLPTTPLPCVAGNDKSGNFQPCLSGWWAMGGGPNNLPSERPGCAITNGVMNSNCIDPNAQKLMQLYFPKPNAGSNGTGFNYVQAFSVPQNSYQNVVRGDWNISDKTQAYVTWSRQRETANMPFGLWNNSGDNVVPSPSGVVGAFASDGVNATLLRMFSPTLTSETRFGYTKINLPSSPSNPSRLLRKDAGFPLTGYYNNPEVPASVSWGSSIPNVGDVGHDYHPNFVTYKGIPSATENLTKVVRNHTTKYGYFEHVYNTQDNWGQFMGVLDYSSWAPSATGNKYSDMLMGIGQSSYFEQALPPPSTLAQNVLAFYAQDDWKLSRRVTVQYGLRFEHYAKPYADNKNGLAVFNPSLYNGGTGTNPGVTAHSLNSSVPLSGADSRLFFFSPRVGAAIDVFGSGKTIVRGGWGKYRAYDSVQSNSYTGPAQQALGSVSFGCGSNDTNCPTWEDVDKHGAANCTAGSNCAPPVVFGQIPNLTNTNLSVMTAKNDEQPLVTSYSLTIDQQLPAKFRMEASYVGNHTDFMQGTVNINAVPLGALLSNTGCTGATCQQAYRPFSVYQNITGSVTAGKAQYDAFQASLLRNVGFLTLQANYTFSKAVGDGVAVNNGGLSGALPDYGVREYWGVLPLDRAQAFTAAYVVNLPKLSFGNSFVRGAANGWQISGITTVESGAQLTNQAPSNGLNFNYSGPLNSTQALGTPDITLYPTFTCNPRSGLGHNQFMNPNCIAATGLGSWGTSKMPYLPGPMFWNSDLTLLKTFQVTERQRLQLRFAAFNFLNHDLLSFTTNDSNLKASSFNSSGQLTVSNFGVAQHHFGHRILEMGVKYSF